MDVKDKSVPDLLGLFRSWIPKRTEPVNVSRDFWMPDDSCRVCYDCDSQFTLFNRKHHCRLCGRVFCANCTRNYIPTLSSELRFVREEWEKIKVCNFCFKQWVEGLVTIDTGIQDSMIDPLGSSPSASSSVSNRSNGTVESCITFSSFPQSMVSYQQNHRPVLSPHQSGGSEIGADGQEMTVSQTDTGYSTDIGNPSPTQLRLYMNRGENDDAFGVHQLESKGGHFCQVNDYYEQVDFDEIDHDYRSPKLPVDTEVTDAISVSSSSCHHSSDSGGSEGVQKPVKKEVEHDIGDECELSSSQYAAEDVDLEPVDFDNNGLLWLPPEPEDEEDDRETVLFDDEEDGATVGEWGYLRTMSSCGSGSGSGGEHRDKDSSTEEQKMTVKNVVDGHFRALVAQLLQVENLPLGEDGDNDGWLEIITSLSWGAATILKPDISKGGGMDPGGYVKVKCIASGLPSESIVVKGVVCKKNVAHRRMRSRIEKPRLLILGGALEYQRVTNVLSSFDTLLQQEMDHLKMAVAKIEAHQPDILLVEKSVSRYAQDYLLAKGISLVLNIKRPILERIARCTDCQIIPTVDHISSQKLGYCDIFHVERLIEEHGTSRPSRKNLKTLMYFEGCSKPLAYTILLKGSNVDELKKLKHVVQYGVFAAYHLAVETSFLADEGATLPELTLNSPITVALPDKPLSIERSISTVPGFFVACEENAQVTEPCAVPQRCNSVPVLKLVSSMPPDFLDTLDSAILSDSPEASSIENMQFITNSFNFGTTFPAVDLSGHVDTESSHYESLYCQPGDEKTISDSNEPSEEKNSAGIIPNEYIPPGATVETSDNEHHLSIDVTCVQPDTNKLNSSNEAFPPSPSDHQSILVSLSSRCVWKGSVCERSHLFRIKYYGNSDKPLGRFLRDQLFDQGYQCESCEMPSEAHVHCYTHRQGTLTISVKRLPEFLLPGERDGKIWMWHRCMRCPRINGIPPATRRIVMSDAAWGLSFGKFLELSFSNHAAASRVASCGHSLHRDCLRFYGFGKMVACFRYATIDVHSVYLPPSKLDFNYEEQEWIQKEMNEVFGRAELLFGEVFDALKKMGERRSGSQCQISDLEIMVQKEKVEFEESFQKLLNKEAKKNEPVDILEINRLRRQLLFQCYMWDHRLIYAANTDSNNLPGGQSIFDNQNLEKPANGNESELKPTLKAAVATGGGGGGGGGIGTKVYDSAVPVDAKTNENNNGSGQLNNNDVLALMKYGNDDLYVEFDGSEPRLAIPRTLSDGTAAVNLSDTLEAAWTGENHPKANVCASPKTIVRKYSGEKLTFEKDIEVHTHRDDIVPMIISAPPPSSSSSSTTTPTTKGSEKQEDSISWLGMSFISFYRTLNKNFLGNGRKLDTLVEYNPVYISSFRELELQGGARLLLPAGVNDTVLPVYDAEPTSIISYALVSPDYIHQLSNEHEKQRDNLELSSSMSSDHVHFQRAYSFDIGNVESGIGSRSSDSNEESGTNLSYGKDLHARVSFGDDGPVGKVLYTVTCYYAKCFEGLRRLCCPSEMDYIRSLSRCKKWGAQGGKSNVFFAKTLDDRFIIKQVTKTELESFMKFAPEYFKYICESIVTRSPTCLAKILGIYQVVAKHGKGGKETKMDVLVMENLLFGRQLTRLYDLKGSSRSRYNADTSKNKVLLDQNLIEAMPTDPIFMGNKAKRSLERAVWNDTSFLASVDVMDYSLLVGVDEEKHELVVGIIDFMRQYTWDKHLETWVKASGILGGPKNASPTVISPKQYKKRFRKAMTTYFPMVPDQWSPPTIITSNSQTDVSEFENCAKKDILSEENNNNNNINVVQLQDSTSPD